MLEIKRAGTCPCTRQGAYWLFAESYLGGTVDELRYIPAHQPFHIHLRLDFTLVFLPAGQPFSPGTSS